MSAEWSSPRTESTADFVGTSAARYIGTGPERRIGMDGFGRRCARAVWQDQYQSEAGTTRDQETSTAQDQRSPEFNGKKTWTCRGAPCHAHLSPVSLTRLFAQPIPSALVPAPPAALAGARPCPRHGPAILNHASTRPTLQLVLEILDACSISSSLSLSSSPPGCPISLRYLRRRRLICILRGATATDQAAALPQTSTPHSAALAAPAPLPSSTQPDTLAIISLPHNPPAQSSHPLSPSPRVSAIAAILPLLGS